MNILLTLFFSVRSVSYGASFFPRTSRLCHKSERKKFGLYLTVRLSNSISKRYVWWEISALESLWNASKPWFPRCLEIFLKFCHIDSVEIGSNFVYASCYILRIYFGGSEMTSCLINNQTYCTSKKSILSIEKLHDNGNYLQKNAEVLTRVVGSWPNVRTFAVCLQQKSRDITREIERRKGKFPVLRKFCHNWIVQIILW